jgi:probable blue pigment (indigoidine) exporter
MGQIPARGWWLKLCVLAALNIGIFQAFLFIVAYRRPAGWQRYSAHCNLDYDGTGQLCQSPLSGVAHDCRGTAWITRHGNAVMVPGMQWDLTGVLAAFAGVCCVSAGAFLVRRWQPPMSVIALTGWQCALGGFMLLPLALLLEPALPALSMQQIAGYSYLSGFGALLAYVLWIRGIQKLPLAASSSLALLSPVVATILGWVILDQKLAAPAMAGMELFYSVFIWFSEKRQNRLRLPATGDIRYKVLCTSRPHSISLMRPDFSGSKPTFSIHCSVLFQVPNSISQSGKP